MKKKLLAAVIMSLAMMAPQANAESGLETAMKDASVDKYILNDDQAISADLPTITNRGFNINDLEGEDIGDHYYSIVGYNHKGFDLDQYAYMEIYNADTIMNFKNNDGNGGAFNCIHDSGVTIDAFIDNDHNSYLVANYASGKGGAIFADYTWGGGTNLINTDVMHNKAGGDGGGIYVDYGWLKIAALPGATVNITNNKSHYVDDENYVPNDIYANNGVTTDEHVRGSVEILTASKEYDPNNPKQTGAGTVNVGYIVMNGGEDLYLSSTDKSTENGAINITSLTLNNTASLNTKYNNIGQYGKHAYITIDTLNMTNGAVLNTVNNYIDNSLNGLNIKNINLDTSINKFIVDADLTTAKIDNFDKVTIGSGTGKINLAVNVIGGDGTESGTLTLIDNVVGNLTIPTTSTQYGLYKYKFTQSAPNSGVLSFTTERATSLQEALYDMDEAGYDMPETTVATSNLGYLRYDPDVATRVFTIYGKGDSPASTTDPHDPGILMADTEFSGIDREGIQIYAPDPQDPTLARGSKLIIKDLDAFSGFTSKHTEGYLGHEGEGGAIHADQAVLDITNVNFINNLASGDPTLTDKRTAGNGGAIYINTWETGPNGTKTIIKDSSFFNNKAVGYGPDTGFVPSSGITSGGAIYSQGNIDISGTLFSGNSSVSTVNGSTAEAGAIFISNTGDKASISDSMFMDNIAGDVLTEGAQLKSTTGSGGAIYSRKANLDISDTSFITNKAQAAGDRDSEWGSEKITGEARGGAIYIDPQLATSGSTVIPNTINIKGSDFIMNSALSYKSVLNTATNEYVLSTDGVNQTRSLGGAIAIMPNKKITVNIGDSATDPTKHTTFIGNESGNGGAIYNYVAGLNITNATFSNNRSTLEGGAIFNDRYSMNNQGVLNLDNVTFSNNYARTGTPEDTIKNDIENRGTLNFVHNGSTLDGGVFGYYYGTTNFNLDGDKSMDIGSNTFISQKEININSGTVNVESGFSLTPLATLTNNANLNIASGWMLPSQSTSGKNEYINNGTMTLGSAGEDVEFLNTQLTNNGLIQGGTTDNKLCNNGSLITNNVYGTINMDIANSPFATLGVTDEDLLAYQNGELNATEDAALIALIGGSEIGAAIDAGTLDAATLSSTTLDETNLDGSTLGASEFGTLINYGTITGDIGNKHGEVYNLLTLDDDNNIVATGTITGDIDNRDGYLENYGIINGDITDNRDGQISNAAGATINGDIGDVEHGTTNGGEIYNDGTINGGVLVNTTSNYHIAKFYNNPNGVVNGVVKVLGAKSIASNNGTIDATQAASDQFVANEGTFTNNGTIKGGLDNSGQFGITANGSINSTGSDVDSVTNNADAILISAGNITTTSLVNNGTFQNGLDPAGSGDIYPNATITGDVTNNNSMVNYGIITGDVDNNNGTFTNGGVINGDVENENGGTFTNNNKINGYADNMDVGSTFINNGSGVIDASETTYQYIDNEGNYENYGTIIGGIDNDGNFYNAGSIDTTGTDGYIENGGLFVNAGNVTANVDNLAFLYNGVNPADPEETMPTATITGDTNNYATIANSGNIVGDIFNDDSLGGATVYLYNGGTVTGDVTSIPDPTTGDNQGALILAVGNGTVTGDVNVNRIGLIPISGTLGELNLQGDVNTDAFVATGGTLNLQNGQTTTSQLGDITLADNTNLKVDADYSNGLIDSISGTLNAASDPNAKINISGLKVTDTNKYAGSKSLDLFNGDEASRAALKDVIATPSSVNDIQPIFNYSGSYDASTGTMKVDKTFNPSVLAAPIAAQLGGLATQLNSYDQAFMNMDMYMMMPSSVRTSMKLRNKIASLENARYDDTKSMYDYAGGWVRPYATFENVPLHNGPRVSNVMYGTFLGGESSLKDLGHGWDGMWGAYVGYNGSHQAYNGVGIYQNGGTLGLSGMAYKGNYFLGGTINVGANAGDASTMFGNEEFAMLMTGAALKTGYNWELANGKFIIQPSLMAAYTFVNTFNYRNAAGVGIESDPLNAITLEPGIKFIGNLKNGWQPYAGVSVVFNVMDKANFNANDVSLPNFSINPFVRYGVGVRKTWGERLTGHFQTYMTNGGRNGVGLSAGLRWAIGKDGSNDVKGQTPELKPTKITLNNQK